MVLPMMTLTGGDVCEGGVSPGVGTGVSCGDESSSNKSIPSIICSCVGPIETDMEQNKINPLFTRDKSIKWTDNPSGRFGQPEEVAALVSFIASKDSSYVT
ncbi:hypothetical protein WG66_008314, partial [Moniliophthora roreri]